nr:S9 family peptidase [Simkaniaceae bacterium]
PFFIVHKKGLKKDQLRPTLLTGYGGFDISYTPSFTPAFFALLEKGGVFALANIRGGGEYGKKWHEGGFRHQKQHSFDDFIAVAETLIKEGYTSPSHLGITGGSNGGLLVAASMLQRPDLFSSVIIRKGVLDMLRFQYFTIGWAWTSEYGNSENQEDFHTLYAYSPLHRIQKGVNYPATLITTADHDNRVVPFHSYKFAATLQSLGGKKNPYLLRVYPNSGHGMGAPRQLYIEEMTDLLTFLLCSF